MTTTNVTATVCIRRKCGYTWIPKVPKPKGCPRCKARQDVQTTLRAKIG